MRHFECSSGSIIDRDKLYSARVLLSMRQVIAQTCSHAPFGCSKDERHVNVQVNSGTSDDILDSLVVIRSEKVYATAMMTLQNLLDE